MLPPGPEEAVQNSNHIFQSTRDGHSFGKMNCKTSPSGSMGSNSRCLSKNHPHAAAMSERKMSFKASLHLKSACSWGPLYPAIQNSGTITESYFHGRFRLDKQSRFWSNSSAIFPKGFLSSTVMLAIAVHQSFPQAYCQYSLFPAGVLQGMQIASWRGWFLPHNVGWTCWSFWLCAPPQSWISQCHQKLCALFSIPFLHSGWCLGKRDSGSSQCAAVSLPWLRG